MSFGSSTTWFSIRSPRRHGALRLICLPHAGGAAVVYDNWGEALGEEIEVWAVQLPGRGRRMMEAPVRDCEALVTQLSDAISAQVEGPWALFGHSMGALLAFQIARRLRDRERAPRHLIVSGLNAPQFPRELRRIHDLPKAQFLQALRELGGTPESVLESQELMELVEPMLRADFSLLETWRYTPAAPLDVPISVLSGRNDPRVHAEGCRAWHEQSTAPVEFYAFGGNHFFLHQEPGPVLDTIRRVLHPSAQSLPKVESPASRA